MAENTGIQWTHYFGQGSGSTWNPIIAIDNETGARGWMCVKHNPACLNCYASHLNEIKVRGMFGTGKSYTVSNLEKSTLHLVDDKKSQSSIDWPLRTKKSRGIFPCSMTEWISEFTPTEFTERILSTMVKADHHVFFPLTKRHELLADLFERKGIYGTAELALAPGHVIFGITVGEQAHLDDAVKSMMKIKSNSPRAKIFLSYEPAYAPINFYPALGMVDWIIMGGESKQGSRMPRPMPEHAITETLKFTRDNFIPFFFKQWGHPKGKEPIIDGKYYREFPDLTPNKRNDV